jgi:hypothetical protein
MPHLHTMRLRLLSHSARSGAFLKVSFQVPILDLVARIARATPRDQL